MSERCAIHPDRAAEITCTRCGSYACYECVGPTSGGICARCRMRVGGGSDRLGQLRICGILMMVHGVLAGCFGALYVAIGILFAVIGPPTNQPDDPPGWGVIAFIIGFGLVNLIPGALQIAGGITMFRRRSRGFTMITLGSGIMSFFGCYCFPTSLALAVWGFILLSDAEVRAAFDAGDAPS